MKHFNSVEELVATMDTKVITNYIKIVESEFQDVVKQRDELRDALSVCEQTLNANFAHPMTIEGRRAMTALNFARTALANSKGGAQ